MLNPSLKTGFSFGLTSGVITTLGLLVGLTAGTESRLAVLGGIITIAIADAFSDALGIHLSEESEGVHTPREIWQSTFTTFAAKFFFALTFLVPFLLFANLYLAASICVIWGLLLLGILSFFVAKNEKTKPWKVIGEHFMIALVVVGVTYFVGGLISSLFDAI